MLKRDITYDNPFTDAKVTETHFFHISKADLVKMEVEEHGAKYTDPETGQELTGMQAKLKRIVDAEDGRAIMREFEDIIRRSYGVKDGDHFLRSEQAWENFRGSGAYDQLLFELCTRADAAAEFTNGVVPNNLEAVAAEIQAEAAKMEASETAPPNREQRRAAKRKPSAKAAADPTGLTESVTPQVLTADQAREMNAEELQAGLLDGRYKLA